MAEFDASAVLVAIIGGLVSVAVVWIPLRWGKKAGANASFLTEPENNHAPAESDLAWRLQRIRAEMHSRFDSLERILTKEEGERG